ncbi:Methane oxygenase PmoA [Mariniphaga anaerophila]|uniref:Methane oxygenase PmoA n=1 Tax=Mariniphaga anaerophila TaxID=1484053 RepID=A0A1M5BAK8_9BACT|nr:PmoA family protein [Mariniphaga anaerophila]SHF39601.1 Methane oxygenase PmoA [Mariniphaga anaerophila]
MKLKLLTLMILASSHLVSQELAKFTVQVEKELIDAPVSLVLDGLNYNTDSGDLLLFEVDENGETPIPSQLETGHSAKLWFIMKGVSAKNSKRNFILKTEKNTDFQQPGVRIQKKHKDLSLLFNEKPVLSYRFETTFPPEGVNPLYKRSGFIHPLWSPKGEVLSRIQAPDHYHHYGIWGPWTLTHIDDREVDFWNLAKGQGTVKFKSFLAEVEGEIFSGFKALQQHIDFGGQGEDQVAMNEILDVRAWNISEKVWVIDYTTSLNSPLPNGIMLNAYRYGGGIGFRATEKWHKNNCSVLTSEGKSRADADGSLARWCIVEGESDTDEGRSGILFLSHPSNRMHPEPMRVWPLNANEDRGDMYFEFVPIRYEDWKLEPLHSYTLKYRMIVFDGEMNAETAEKYWNSFSSMPKIEIKK